MAPEDGLERCVGASQPARVADDMAGAGLAAPGADHHDRHVHPLGAVQHGEEGLGMTHGLEIDGEGAGPRHFERVIHQLRDRQRRLLPRLDGEVEAHPGVEGVGVGIGRA